MLLFSPVDIFSVSYFRIEVKEDIVFKAKQQSVIFSNALLHKRTR